MRKKNIGSIPVTFLLIILTYVPFLFILSNSLKTDSQIAKHPLAAFIGFHVHNYAAAWQGMARYLGNTVIVAMITVLIVLPCAGAAGYAFSQIKFKGKNIIFYGYLGLLMIPWTLTLIPLFLEVKNFGLYGSWWALILPYAAGGQPLLVYLFRIFFEGIPEELYESARIDGCGDLGILFRIVTPLSMPVILTGMVLTLINVWGDYLWPTIVLPNYKMLTVSAGLQNFLGSFGLTGHGAGAAYAAYVLAMAPIVLVVVFSMKYFVNGVTAGSLKG